MPWDFASQRRLVIRAEQNWTNYVRIGAYGLQADNAEAIVRDAQKNHVFGIEVDNDIPGRYESFLDPTAKLKAIRALAEPPTQIRITPSFTLQARNALRPHADQPPSLRREGSSGMVQRNIAGDPAVFTSGAAFWISPGDEDVWISPYAMDWRKIYMERVRQIAATGIDGIYVDIPYWMTHFDGWENSWASFDDATVAAFRR